MTEQTEGAEAALTADERETIAAAVIVSRTLPLAARRGHLFAAVERIIAAREAAAEVRGAQVVLAAAQAEAWDQGYRTSESDFGESEENECDVYTPNPYRAALVACVDPSPSESGSTDPEVRQSADRTSSPSRVPGEHRTFHCDRCHQPAMNIDANGLCRACRVPGEET